MNGGKMNLANYAMIYGISMKIKCRNWKIKEYKYLNLFYKMYEINFIFKSYF